MSVENQKAKHGGISFDVILKPQTDVSKPPQLSPREVKKRELSEEQINNKLKRAEERRSLIEQERMDQLAKERQKALEVMSKAQCESEKFSQKTKEKLRRSMEIRKENREYQIKALQERLREHSLKVDEVQNAGEEMVKEFEAKSEQKLSKKMETYEENRQNQLKGMLAKLKEHADHINEVCAASENRSQISDELNEQLVQKMENALRNREDHLTALQERMAERDNRIKEAQKKREVSECGDGDVVAL